jgi:hypothetical protein
MHSSNLRILSAAIGVILSLAASGRAQQSTAEPGSPGATAPIDGKHLPPPDSKFGGEINLKAASSKRWWPPCVVPLP